MGGVCVCSYVLFCYTAASSQNKLPQPETGTAWPKETSVSLSQCLQAANPCTIPPSRFAWGTEKVKSQRCVLLSCSEFTSFLIKITGARCSPSPHTPFFLFFPSSLIPSSHPAAAHAVSSALHIISGGDFLNQGPPA